MTDSIDNQAKSILTTTNCADCIIAEDTAQFIGTSVAPISNLLCKENI